MAASATTGAPRAAVLPDFVQRPSTGPYLGLNPSTKLVVALAEAIVAFTLRGWSGPLLVLGIVAASAAWARLGRAFLPFLLATIPLVASILLVNTLFFPGATDPIVQLGPLSPTWTGLAFATQATLRVVAFAMSVALFGLTTPIDHLVADLERRGVGRRAVFLVAAVLRAVPRLIERAREITDAQRARGMDTEGRFWRRVRGLLPLAAPLVFGALTDVEEQTMALEARAFSAARRRTPLRAFPDSDLQRTVRWVVALGTVVIVAGSVSGMLGFLP